MMLVRATTPLGNVGFFRFTPPPNTLQQQAGALVFAALDAHGRGPSIQGRAVGQNRAEVIFTSDDEMMSFSDYVVRAGGQVIPLHQDSAYRAALQEWNAA